MERWNTQVFQCKYIYVFKFSVFCTSEYQAILFKTHFKRSLSLTIQIVGKLEALEVVQDNNHSERF